MSARAHGDSRSRSHRQLAARKVASRPAVDLDALSSSEIRDLVHELEVHKIELETQNEQLKQTQRSEEESRERYRRLYDSAPIGFLTLDSGGAIVEANLAVSTLLKVPRSRVIGRKLSKFVAPWHQDRWHLERRTLARGKRRSVEIEFARSDGHTLRAQLVSSGAQGRSDRDATIPLAMIDVTELRDKERALRSAAAAATLAEQQERRKLASDLHDDAGQLLSLASMKLRALADDLAGERHLGLREVEEILTEVRQRISSLSFQLNPPLLHDLGFVAAAHWLAEDLERRYGIVVQVVAQEELKLGEVACLALFRALRELLINVKKHAGVGGARVRIWYEGGRARVAVEDSGVGLDPEADRRGYGLLALRERLEQLGGTLDIGSVMGAGTRIVASVPLTSGTADGGGGSAP